MATRHAPRYRPIFHKILSQPALLKRVRNSFEKIVEPTTVVVTPKISLTDVLMSGLAIFSLKYPSLLQFDNNRNAPKVKANLARLFGVKKAPCDTQMRARLDEIDPVSVRPAVAEFHQLLQRQGVLNSYHFLEDQLLLSVDGTDYFKSTSIHCPHCNVKHKTNGEIEYSHQALGCSIVHPDHHQVFPLFHEEIHKKEGQTKNDCEQNAAKRLLPAIREVYPKQKITLLEDSLYATAPHIKLLRLLDFNYIIAAKPGDHAFLFKTFDQWMCEGKTEEFEGVETDGTIRGYRFANDLPLNKSNQDIRVNFVEHWEIAAHGRYKGQQKLFTFITEHTLTRETVCEIAQGGRTRSKIENETFNTLKNQAYHLEHNYGHGKNHLASLMVSLMFLVFLIDQIQEACCEVFQTAHKVSKSRIALWERIRGLFLEFYIEKWEDVYLSIIYGQRSGILKPDVMDTS